MLEALGSTRLNLLLDVGFNREVAENSALYWNKQEGNLAKLIDDCENLNRDELGKEAKKRIQQFYSWQNIADKYMKIWL